MTWDAVYLSPHLDDAVLSCGGQIHRRTAAGEKILVLTALAGDEPREGSIAEAVIAEFLRRASGLAAGTVAVERRREDEAACRILGAEHEHWDLPEAIYRRRAGTGYPLYSSFRKLFGPTHEEDEPLVATLTGRLRRAVAGARLIVPLGVGGHVDHRLVRRAAEDLDDSPIAYYEEFPYVLRWRALGRALGRRREWSSEAVVLDEADVEARRAAALAYPSQIRMLFGDPRKFERRLRRHLRSAGGERVWRRADQV